MSKTSFLQKTSSDQVAHGFTLFYIKRFGNKNAALGGLTPMLEKVVHVSYIR